MKWVANLTLKEYIDLGYTQAIDHDDFATIEAQAQRHIDAVTNYYYKSHDIEHDDWPDRVDAYKSAICEQIDFIKQTGVAASYDAGDNFQSVSIGRLSLSSAIDPIKNGTVGDVCKEAYQLLGRYGLLYRGVGSKW